jgi:hypothetical protein
MIMKLITFNNIGGVPIHYARAPVAQYGTRGKGPRNVRLDQIFLAELTKCLEELWELCPWGRPNVLVSGGCYVVKAGAHGFGRGIDIDAIWWENASSIPTYSLITFNAPHDALCYIAVWAILNKHFGNVLGYWYNSAHEDHFHVDDMRAPGYRPASRAQLVFLQAALTYVYGFSTNGIDGIVGDATRAALKNVDISNWSEFLVTTAKLAFSKVK